jgi:hypothetical protein
LRRALQPYSSAAPTPATLGLRFLAALVDLMLLNTVIQAVLLLMVGDPFTLIDRLAREPGRAWLLVLPSFALVILYYALTEWRWGATAGKALCRLRVLQADRNYPTLSQALLRAALVMIVPVLPVWVWIMATGDPLALVEPSSRMFALSFSYYVLLALLFVSVRRSNGFAALHDLATRTRVVSRAAWEQRPALNLSELQPAGVESKPMVGPYHVLQPLGRCGEAEWAEGYDLRLLRRVLLRRVPPGTPSLPAVVQQVSRPGRLRWLTGRRDAQENWDSFEGADGQPLLKLAEQPQPWGRVRFWLHDLAAELTAAEREGSLPPVLALDRVWITRDGRAKLLDYPAPGTVEPDASACVSPAGTLRMPGAAPKVFLDRVAAMALAGRAGDEEAASTVAGILPLHARRFLEAMPKLAGPEAVAEGLKPLLRRAAEVTRLRRAVIVTACVALPLIGSFAAVLGLSLTQRWQQQNPELIELSNVLNTWRAKKLPFVPADRLPSDRLIGIYIAAHYGGFITNGEAWSSVLARTLIPLDARQFAERSLVQYSTPAKGELQEAEKLLGTVARQSGAAAMPSPQSLGPLILWSCLLLYAATPAVIAALLFRGGLVLWIAGVTYVRRDGRRASRLRLLWRGVVAWSPVAVAAVLGLAAMPTKSVTLALLGGLLLAALTTWSLWLPKRGLPDRLAGTWPVPR